ncbi:hypothetical protein EYF80_024818 [Liparis tanakae]|uniref:Uncharacterized protein n=1 Tax=Liparis tanakae TaxID=230148 RepID=A0A4Z2HJ24_9TELE|nr:hypothetical protein EYF80_024818 [Liparis tanakae]
MPRGLFLGSPVLLPGPPPRSSSPVLLPGPPPRSSSPVLLTGPPHRSSSPGRQAGRTTVEQAGPAKGSATSPSNSVHEPFSGLKMLSSNTVQPGPLRPSRMGVCRMFHWSAFGS